MDAVVARIFELISQQNLTAKEVAIHTGITASNFTEWKKGRSKPSFGALVKLAEFFGVSIEYLQGKTDKVDYKPKPRHSDEALKIAGWWDQLDEMSQAIIKGDILRRLEHIRAAGGKSNIGAISKTHPTYTGLMLPVVGRSAAGLPILMIETQDDAVSADDDTQARPGDFVVIADGDSMVDAGIHNGDNCIIRPQESVENGQIALVVIGDGSTIKRFYKDNDGFRLMPCNDAYPVQHYGMDAPIRILGRFVAVAK